MKIFDKILDWIVEEVFPILAVVLFIIILIFIVYLIISLIKDCIIPSLRKKKVKISYATIIDKSTKENLRMENMLVGNNMIPMHRYSEETIIWIEFEEEKFKISNSFLYEKAEIGDKVIIKCLESKYGIESIELIEIIE